MTYDAARELVNDLKTLPFCPDSDGLKAVAHDLVAWCQGFQGWTPEQQAMWTVQQIRNTWDAWHGSKAMREIFDGKFTMHPPDDPTEEWRRQGLKPDPGFGQNLLSRLNGKATSEQLDELRWEGIRDALEYQRRPQRQTDKSGRKFWGDFLAQMEKDHPEEVRTLSAGREPWHSKPGAYRLNWAGLPEKQREAIVGAPGSMSGAPEVVQ
jgi:hypothetical protein